MTKLNLTAGVSTTATANNLVMRDSNANAFSNNFVSNARSIVTSASPVVLTASSPRINILTGSTAQTIQLPDATTLTLGTVFSVNNNSSQSATVNNNGASLVYTVPAGGDVQINLLDVSTANGSWDVHPLAPSITTWGTAGSPTGLTMNNALTSTAAVSSGASAATTPVFIPQRGSATTGLGGAAGHATLIAGGVNVLDTVSTGASTTLPFTVNTNASATPGAIVANGPLHVVGVDSAATNIYLDTFAGTPVYRTRRADGTGASPSAVASGVTIGSFGASAYDGSSYISTGSLAFQTTEVQSSGHGGTKAVIQTTATSSASSAATLTLNNPSSTGIQFNGYGAGILTTDASGNISAATTVTPTGAVTAFSGTAPPASGTGAVGITFSSTATLGVFCGTGAPTFAAAKGSIYTNTTASTTTTRLYVNTNGSTTWTNLTTAA